MCLNYLENNEHNRIWALNILDATCNRKSKRKYNILLLAVILLVQFSIIFLPIIIYKM